MMPYGLPRTSVFPLTNTLLHRAPPALNLPSHRHHHPTSTPLRHPSHLRYRG